jgi:hypothetical protein
VRNGFPTPVLHVAAGHGPLPDGADDDAVVALVIESKGVAGKPAALYAVANLVT